MTSYSRHYWAKSISQTTSVASSQVSKILSLATEKYGVTNFFEERTSSGGSYGPVTNDEFQYAHIFDLENEEISTKDFRKKGALVKDEYLVLEGKATFCAFPDCDVNAYVFDGCSTYGYGATHFFT